MGLINKNNDITTKIAKGMISSFLFKIILMSTILVIQSCQTENLSSEIKQNEQEIALKSGQLTFEEFITNHLSISEDIMALTKNEEDINTYFLSEENLNEAKNVEELKVILQEANFNQTDDLLLLYNKLSSNINAFIQSNPTFYNLNESERDSILINEIDKQLFIEEEQSNRLSCEGIRGRAENRCLRNFSISADASVVIGAATGGFGWLLGYAVANGIFILCLEDAQSDYEDCVSS